MAAIIAGKKGHSAVSFFAGLILGVFGVLLAWWQDDLTKAEPPAAHNRITAFSAALLAAAPAAAFERKEYLRWPAIDPSPRAAA